MKYAYNIMISRFDEDGNQSELIDRDINADQAIDLMCHIKENIPDHIVEADEMVPEEEPEIVADEEDEDEEPAPKKISVDIEQREGPGWDRELAKIEIKLGKYKAGKIAELCGTSIGNIYQLKSQMKKDGELDGEEESDGPPVAEVLQNRINDMVNDGMDYDEIYRSMHNSLTEKELKAAYEYAQQIES